MENIWTIFPLLLLIRRYIMLHDLLYHLPEEVSLKFLLYRMKSEAPNDVVPTCWLTGMFSCTEILRFGQFFQKQRAVFSEKSDFFCIPAAKIFWGLLSPPMKYCAWVLCWQTTMRNCDNCTNKKSISPNNKKNLCKITSFWSFLAKRARSRILLSGTWISKTWH